MKKIISLALAILMIAMTMVACKNNENGDESSTPDDYIPSSPAASTPESTPKSTPESTPESNPPSTDVLEDCDETVYVIDAKTLFLRSEPNFEETSIAGAVDYGTELRRIGKNDVWSKVVYENVEYYISSKYVSTEKPAEVVFEDREETVYVLQDAFYRSIPSMADSAIVDSLAKGTEIKRTGIMFEEQDAKNNPDGVYGWSRVEIDGETYYMRNSVLSTEAPVESTPESSVESTPESSVESTPESTVETTPESTPAN